MDRPVMKPPEGAKSGFGNLTGKGSERQFRLAPRIAPGVGGAWRRARADKAPADRGGVAGILADHDLGSAARAVIAGQKHAVLEIDLVVERLEGPDVAVRQYQHDAARIAEAAGL